MAGPRRFVDAHVHLWDTGSGFHDLSPIKTMGGNQPAPDRYLIDDHVSGASDIVDVYKIVHVSASVDPKPVLRETRWVNQLADESPIPFAIVGTLDPSASPAEIQLSLDEQMVGGRFRGIRLLGGLDHETAQGATVLRALADRGLLYDAVAHPGGGIAATARAAAAFPDVPFVLEHTGWPLESDNADHFGAWRAEITELAKVPTAYCKLSGLAMTYQRFEASDFAPYFEHCLEEFGPSRCMIGSNYPVDGLYGSFAEALTVYMDLVANLTEEERDALFADNAERIYRV